MGNHTLILLIYQEEQGVNFMATQRTIRNILLSNIVWRLNFTVLMLRRLWNLSSVVLKQVNTRKSNQNV